MEQLIKSIFEIHNTHMSQHHHKSLYGKKNRHHHHEHLYGKKDRHHHHHHHKVACNKQCSQLYNITRNNLKHQVHEGNAV